MNILKGPCHSFFFVRVYNSLTLNHQRLILKYFDKIELKDKGKNSFVFKNPVTKGIEMWSDNERIGDLDNLKSLDKFVMIAWFG